MDVKQRTTTKANCNSSPESLRWPNTWCLCLKLHEWMTPTIPTAVIILGSQGFCENNHNFWFTILKDIETHYPMLENYVKGKD